MRISSTLIALIITTSVATQIFVSPCVNHEEIDFGFCDMAMRIAVVGGKCVYFSGFGLEVCGVDYSQVFFTSHDSCEEDCLQSSYCLDIEWLDFGESLAVLGIANVGGTCTWVSGCSTYFEGVDDSFTLYEFLEYCYSSCTLDTEGCSTYSFALNYNPNATFDDGTCLFHEYISECSGDVNGDDNVTVHDILQI